MAARVVHVHEPLFCVPGLVSRVIVRRLLPFLHQLLGDAPLFPSQVQEPRTVMDQQVTSVPRVIEEDQVLPGSPIHALRTMHVRKRYDADIVPVLSARAR